MRIGIFSLTIIFVLFFLILINNTPLSESEINEVMDKAFESLDQNTLASTETRLHGNGYKLENFMIYSSRGILHELHGSYYLVSWINDFLPNWILDNLTLILILLLLSLISPLIWYGFLIIVFIITVIYEKWKEWNKRRVSG